MQLSVLEKVSASLRLPSSDTGGPKYSPVATGAFVGLASQTKL